MIWLYHLFRRNHDARRARWFVFGACCGSIVIAWAYGTSQPACAADPAQCKAVAGQIGDIVLSATDDLDLMQAVAAAAEARCILLDDPPVKIVNEPAATPPPAASPKDQWCGKHFRTYRASDGTVLRGGSRKRSACPWPG